MKQKNKRLLSALAILLILALVLGAVLTLANAGVRTPDRPIDPEPSHLDPASMAHSGGSGAGNSEDTQPATEPETQPETEPATEQPTTTPTEPSEETTPTTTPTGTNPSDTKPDESIPSPSGDVTEPSSPDATGQEPDPSTPGTGPTSPTVPDPGPTEPEDPDVTPHIVTDLQSRAWTPKELKNDTLRFYAYGAGGTSLSVKVYWKEQSSSANNGRPLTPESGEYSLKMALNTSYKLTLYLYQNGKAIGAPAAYYVSYQAELADEDHPEVGDAPPIITTNRDGVTDTIRVQQFVLRVSARTGGEDGGQPIYENHLQVWLDGSLVRNPTGNAWNGFEYTLRFSAPEIGDHRDYTVHIRAWDDNGNSTYRTLTIRYETVSKGDPIGSATVRVDITTLGLGITDEETLTILQGDTYAEVVRKALEDLCGYTLDYSGTTGENGGFYLRGLYRSDMLWGAKPDPRLWQLILRDGITLTSEPDPPDRLGEMDYTRGSGWMYDVNGAYPGFGMDGGFPSDGDVITLRFTLAFGKDIDGYGATGGQYGSLSSYCGIWRDGTFIPLSHDYRETARVEPTATQDGYIEKTCSKCGDVTLEVLPATDPQPTEPTTPTKPSQPTEPTDPPTEPTTPATEPPTEPSAPPTEPSDPEPSEELHHRKKDEPL